MIALTSLAFAGIAGAQTTVGYNTTAWADFGTTNQSSVSGNFQPGWTTTQGSPDLSAGNVFNQTHQTLSGATNDAGLWFNGNNNVGLQERAQLSLSGFTPGSTYTLDFSASLLQKNAANWNGSQGNVIASITGANISSWTSTLLTDANGTDNLNNWESQSITFTAGATGIVGFEFTGTSTQTGTAIRVGIDGMSATLAPEPSSTALLGLGALGLLIRRKR